MTANKVIDYTEFFGKVDAIVVKGGKVELQETKIQRSDCCWKDQKTPLITSLQTARPIPRSAGWAAELKNI